MTNTNTTVSAPKNNNVGSAILALSGMLRRSFRKPQTPKQIACLIALEKNGTLRPVADRIATGKALSAEAYKTFVKLAKTDKGAAKVVTLAKDLVNRTQAIQLHKADLSPVPTVEAAA